MVSTVETTPIIAYRAFWDVPRWFLIQHRGRLLLFAAPWDDELDDYAAEYSVYALPPDVDLDGDWVTLPPQAQSMRGRVAVGAMRFDETRRAGVELAPIEDIARGAGWR